MKRLLFLPLIICLISIACNYKPIHISFFPTPTIQNIEVETLTTDEEYAEITFRVQVPTDTPSNQPIYLKVVEEVTGLALNAKANVLGQVDNNHYEITLPFKIGSVIKYRYSKLGDNVENQEHVSDGRAVRYRIYQVQNPGLVEDIISRWTDSQYNYPSGRIQGQIKDATNGKPAPGLLIAVGGFQTISSSDGSFLVEGLPVGVHNLVVYSLDGTYQTFQQGAKIAEKATTPTQIFINPTTLVDVQFILTPPENSIPAVPIRVVGNLHQFGNTYADLTGGVSTIASRIPTLTLNEDGQYVLSIALPSKADIRYLYTLGDGLWNAELSKEGAYKIRQLIIPDTPIIVQDNVETWVSKDRKPITFDVTVPDSTSTDDYVSIQFNPIYGWTEPIPMWRLGDNHWGYILTNPLNILDNLTYRFCKNDQCGSADDENTLGLNNSGNKINTEFLEKPISYKVQNWAWSPSNIQTVEITTPQVLPRMPSFWAGIEFTTSYHPSWDSLFPMILDQAQHTGSNWLILTPAWTFTLNNPPNLEISPGKNQLWNDLITEISQASDRGFSVGLKPSGQFDLDTNIWWQNGIRDYSWWQVWFERYQIFAIHHADIASETGIQSLILGGDWLTPALPNGSLMDGTPSGAPEDADARWRLLISEVKKHYNGPLFWSLTYDQVVNAPPSFLDQVDGIYLEWSQPLIKPGETYTTQTELEKEAARIFDNAIIPLISRYRKPLVISVSYPSADGAASGCILNSEGKCISNTSLKQPGLEVYLSKVDLQEQVDLYNAILAVINQRNWIYGFVSAGYYPPVALIDHSTSIHGKPAEELIAYWYTNFYPTDEIEP